MEPNINSFNDYVTYTKSYQSETFIAFSPYIYPQLCAKFQSYLAHHKLMNHSSEFLCGLILLTAAVYFENVRNRIFLKSSILVKFAYKL